MEPVLVDVVGDVADQAAVVHAEGGSGEFCVEVVDELGDAGLAAGRRRRSAGCQGSGQVGAVGGGIAGSGDRSDDDVWVERVELVAVIAAAVLGIGFGVFTSVDFALLTQVLPTSTDRGKDLGVLNVANALPQVLAPAVAAPIVALAGGYPMLYGVAGALAIGGGVLVWKIEGVA